MFTALVNFGVAFVALMIVMLIVGQPFYWTILMTVTIVPAVLLFSLGIGFALASLYVFFRDVKHLYEVFITLWMYLTPIFYTANSLNSQTIQTVIGINPMTQFVTAFRSIIQWGVVPNWQSYLICYGWAFVMLAIGYVIFKINILVHLHKNKWCKPFDLIIRNHSQCHRINDIPITFSIHEECCSSL